MRNILNLHTKNSIESSFFTHFYPLFQHLAKPNKKIYFENFFHISFIKTNFYRNIMNLRKSPLFFANPLLLFQKLSQSLPMRIELYSHYSSSESVYKNSSKIGKKILFGIFDFIGYFGISMKINFQFWFTCFHLESTLLKTRFIKTCSFCWYPEIFRGSMLFLCQQLQSHDVSS